MRDYKIILPQGIVERAVAQGFIVESEKVTAEEIIHWLAVEHKVLATIGTNPPHTSFYGCITGCGRRVWTVDDKDDTAISYRYAVMQSIDKALGFLEANPKRKSTDVKNKPQSPKSAGIDAEKFLQKVTKDAKKGEVVHAYGCKIWKQ